MPKRASDPFVGGAGRPRSLSERSETKRATPTVVRSAEALRPLSERSEPKSSHSDARVAVRPLAVRAEHIDVQPNVTLDVRFERARATMLQLDDLDARGLLAEESTMAASRVELGLPPEQDAITQQALKRLGLARELGMQQCPDAVRLRLIERPVEHQVRIRAQAMVASFLPRDRVVPGEPHTKAPGRELVSRDDVVVDDESREMVESNAAPYASSASAPVG